MSIRAIRNQPFQFGNNLQPRSLALMCCADDPVPSLIAVSDEVWAQATLGVCEGDTDIIFQGGENDWDGFGFLSGWNPYNGVYRCLSNNPGSVVTYPFSPTIGVTYTIQISGIFLYDDMVLSFGGSTFAVGQTGPDGETFEFDVLAGNNNSIEIVSGTGFYILTGILVTTKNFNVSVIFHADSGNLEFNNSDYPDNFYFFNGGFTFHMPMSTVGIAEGCFSLELRDNCSDTGMTSQVFRIVDVDCETFLIRACNDYDNIGFVAPFVPRIRIPASMGWPSYNTDVQEERHSDGEIFRPYGDRTRTMTVKTGILNEFDHAFLSTLPLYDHVYIGSGDQAQEVVVNKGKYEPLYGEGQNLNGAVVFDVTPKAELVRKVRCGPALDGCAPKSDPQCIGGPQHAWTFVPVDGGFDFQLTIFSASNFTPSTASITVADGAPVTQTVGALPSTLTWGPFAAETPLTLRIFDAMNANCVMTKFFDVPPTVFCGVPDLEYNFIDNGDSTFDLEITMNTTEGFTPGDIYVEQGGVTAGEQTFGALPDTLTFASLNNSQAVTVHFVNLVEGCPPYVEDIGVPEEPELLCEGDETASFTVQSGGTAYLYMVTSTGSFTARNAYGDLYIRPSEEGLLELPTGQYCVYPSDGEGTKSGTVTDFAVSGDIVDLVTERLISTIWYQYLGLPVITSMPAVASTNTALIYYVISYGTLLTSVPPMGDYEDLEVYQVNNCPLITSIPDMNPSARMSLVFTGDDALATFGVLPIIRSITISGSNITDPDVVDAIINALNPPEGTSGFCIIGSLLSLRTSASDTNYNACVSAGWTFA